MKKGGGFVKRSGKTTKITKPAERAGHVFLQPLRPNDADTKCYLLGGYCDNGPLCDVWSFHVNSSTWKLLSNEEMSKQSPLPRYEFDGCLTSSGIYVFGGFQSDGHEVAITNDLWLFDLEYETWKLVSEESKPPERSGHVMVTIDHDKFIVHGGTCMGARGDLWVYETSLHDWWEVPCELGKSPCPRWMHSAAFCRDSQLLVIFGGLTQPQSSSDAVASALPPSSSPSPEYLNDLWILDMNGINSTTASRPWQMVQYQGLAPSPRDLPAIAAMNGSIIIMGGFGLLEVDELDFEEDEEEEEEGEEDEEDEDDEEGEESAKCAGMDLENDNQVEKHQHQEQNAEEEHMIVSVGDVSVTIDESHQVVGTLAMMSEPESGPEINDHDNDNEDEADEGDEEDGDIESIDIAYLDDTWYINLQTSEASGMPLLSTYPHLSLLSTPMPDIFLNFTIYFSFL